MQQRDAGGRSGVRWGDAATLVGLVLYAVRPALPAFVPALAGAALIAARLRPLPGDGRFSRPARAVVGGLCLYTVFGRSWFVWPAYLLVPLLVAVALAVAAGFWRDLLATLERGRLGRTEWGLIALISALAGAALIGWVSLFQPDLSRVREMLPRWPLPGLIAAGLGFSVVNAVLEEVIWRGVLQRWLASFMAPAAALAVQAASFGALHYSGFPSGLVGVALATAYGLMIGALALRSRGLAAPILAHISADLVIFTVVASSAATAASP